MLVFLAKFKSQYNDDLVAFMDIEVNEIFYYKLILDVEKFSIDYCESLWYEMDVTWKYDFCEKKDCAPSEGPWLLAKYQSLEELTGEDSVEVGDGGLVKDWYDFILEVKDIESDEDVVLAPFDILNYAIMLGFLNTDIEDVEVDDSLRSEIVEKIELLKKSNEKRDGLIILSNLYDLSNNDFEFISEGC